MSLAVLPQLATAALDLVFPARCPVCGVGLGQGRRDPLCGACWDAIVRIAPPYCGRCGAPVTTCEPPEGHVPPCAVCTVDGPAYDYARSAARYEGALREALHRFKFEGRRALARPLADLAVEQCGATLPDGIAAVVPVPLARDREWERGFNQAALLAERVAARLGVRVRAGWLTRRRATRPQSDLSASERRTNVRGAFGAAPAVAGRHVLVMDDVMTTGATLDECARALRAAGAARIGVLTVARVL